MRICLLTEYFDPDGAGGTPTILPALARGLTERHDDVTLDVLTSRNVYRGGAERLPAREQWAGMRVFRLGTPRSNDAGTAGRLVKGGLFTLAALARLHTLPRYDVLLVGTNPPTAPLAARWRRLPYVYLIHDLYPDVAVALGALPPNAPVTRACRRSQQGWLHGAAQVIVIGRCMRDHLTETYALPPERMSVIPCWADARAVTPLPRPTRFRAAQRLDGFVVLYAGNFGQHQRFATILDAAARLRDRCPAITFVLVGHGVRQDEITRRIAADALHNVRLCPMVPTGELPDLLASADVALVTLEPGMEGIGVPSKFYNILAAGRATVALLAPGSEVARVIDEAQCGVQVDAEDAGQLAETLYRLSIAPDTVARMGACARAALEQRFTLEHAADAFYQVFRSVRSRSER